MHSRGLFAQRELETEKLPTMGYAHEKKRVGGTRKDAY